MTKRSAAALAPPRIAPMAGTSSRCSPSLCHTRLRKKGAVHRKNQEICPPTTKATANHHGDTLRTRTFTASQATYGHKDAATQMILDVISLSSAAIENCVRKVVSNAAETPKKRCKNK